MQVLDFIMTKLPYLLIIVVCTTYTTYNTIKTVSSKEEKLSDKIFFIMLLILTYTVVSCMLYYLW